jgi:hypothetical protein
VDDLEQQLVEAWTTVCYLPAYELTPACPSCAATVHTPARHLTPLEAAALTGHDARDHRWLVYPVICRTCPCGRHFHQRPIEHDTYRPAGITTNQSPKPKRPRTPSTTGPTATAAAATL